MMRIMKLPVVLDPYPDELLSSWIGRMSRAYGRTPYAWCSLLSPRGLCCARDVNVVSDDQLIADLSLVTGIPKEKFFEMQLISYEGCLYPTYDKSTRSISQFHITRARIRLLLYGFQCCPKCSFDDEVPYWRKQWRLAFMVGCSRHNLLLLDSCPKCGTAFALSKRMPRQEITVCTCGYDMKYHKVDEKVSASVRRLQSRFLELLKKSEFEIESGIFISSCEFFGLLQRIFRVCSHEGLLFNRTHSMLDYFLSAHLKLPIMHIQSKNYIEQLTIIERLTIMIIVDFLLNKWPERFLNMCRECKVTKMLIGDKHEGYVWNILKDIKH